MSIKAQQIRTSLKQDPIFFLEMMVDNVGPELMQKLQGYGVQANDTPEDLILKLAQITQEMGAEELKNIINIDVNEEKLSKVGKEAVFGSSGDLKTGEYDTTLDEIDEMINSGGASTGGSSSGGGGNVNWADLAGNLLPGILTVLGVGNQQQNAQNQNQNQYQQPQNTGNGSANIAIWVGFGVVGIVLAIVLYKVLKN